MTKISSMPAAAGRKARSAYRGVYVGAVEMATSPKRLFTSRLTFTFIVTTALLSFSGIAGAAAADPAAGGGDCGNDGTSSLVNLLMNFGVMIYVVGGALFLISLGLAGLHLMLSGAHKQFNSKKAYDWARNAVIGMAFLAMAYALRNIIVDWVGNAGAGATGTDTPGINGSLTDCSDIQAS